MSELHRLLLLGLVLVVASALPFIPTGPIASAAAALAAPSIGLAVATFVIAAVCSAIGDTLLLTGVRLLSRPLAKRQRRRPLSPKILSAQDRLVRNLFSAVVTARLVPGMRVPVILALGLSTTPRRRFVLADVVGCTVWAALYTAVGTLGGRLTTHPSIAIAVAVLTAVGLSSLVGFFLRRRPQVQSAA